MSRWSAVAEMQTPSHLVNASALNVSVIVPVYNERHLVATSLRRVFALRHPLIASLEVIVVDDCSTDGTSDVLQRLQREFPQMILMRHERNSGKGAAIRTALGYVSGDVVIFHDADLEYDPADIPALLKPFVDAGADAVFGSRYLSGEYRRALGFKHSLVNRFLSNLTSWFTDFHLTDVETCYKVIRTSLLKSIPIRSSDFRFEIEITTKLAKRRALIFEVPIRYLPRSVREGKKIRALDGLLALNAVVKYHLIDDIYQDDEYGSRILYQLERTRKFNLWVGDVLRPYVGDHVLEIGAGIGNLTQQFIPREYYVASDLNPIYIDYLHAYGLGKPYMQVRSIDVTRKQDFATLEKFDTVLMVNVLEHVSDPAAALDNIYDALMPGGKALILVPQHPWLYGTLDVTLEHRERYTRTNFERSLRETGFVLERVIDFNRASMPGWWFTGRVLKRKVFSRLPLKLFDVAIPVLRRMDRWLPWPSQSLIAVARRPEKS
jgi:glycosyltransferase involved in cell wall biosynthesis